MSQCPICVTLNQSLLKQISDVEKVKPEPVISEPESSEPDVLDDVLAEMAGELLPAKHGVCDEVPEPDGLEPQVLSFIEQIVDRAKGTGAFTAAQGFASERFKDDGNALNYCLFRLDEVQAASAAPAA